MNNKEREYEDKIFALECELLRAKDKIEKLKARIKRERQKIKIIKNTLSW